MRILFALAPVAVVGLAFAIGHADDTDLVADDEPIQHLTIDPLADAPSPSVTCGADTFEISQGNSLVVRSLAVVEHADAEGTGPWSFGGLMTALTPAGYPGGAAGFTRDWLAQWETDVEVNGAPTPRVTNIRDKLIDHWPRDGARLDLAKSPFRLLAIVNRIDRYDLAAGRAGELRFVFSAVEANKQFDNRKLPMNFTVIFEFRQPGSTLADAQAIAREWAALSDVRVDSAGYHTRLRAITDAVTADARGNLRAVRTNEVSLDDPWDLRHFELRTGGALRLAPLEMTPMIKRNRSAALTTWMFDTASRPDILLGRHRLPANLAGNFAPMTMVREGKDSFRWETDGSRPKTDATNDLRHAFSLFTCNGCHSGETSTSAVHIVPRERGSISELSKFMTGETIDDIVAGPSQRRHFNDLARRERAFDRLVCGRDADDADRSFDE
ncbi:MAG: hypothetical protein ABI867_21995 [Kofleriaceae bacterium]